MTQAVKCIIPGYLLFGTALPLVATVIVSAISEQFSESEFYFRFAMGLLYVTTPMFTFFITFVSIIINYYANLLVEKDDYRIELFAEGMMTAEPVTAFCCFAGQALFYFGLVVLIDRGRMNAFRHPDPITPSNVPPVVAQNSDIVRHEESVRDQPGFMINV